MDITPNVKNEFKGAVFWRAVDTFKHLALLLKKVERLKVYLYSKCRFAYRFLVHQVNKSLGDGEYQTVQAVFIV